MNGRDKYLTASIVSKAVRLRDQLLKGETPVLPLNRPSERDEEKNGIFIPRETLAFYESLARACENLSGIVSRLMPGGLPTEPGKKVFFLKTEEAGTPLGGPARNNVSLLIKGRMEIALKYKTAADRKAKEGRIPASLPTKTYNIIK